jgi:transketolase
VNGVEQNTGALGHGLAVAAGIALAGKMDRKDYRVFTLLGDGELAEGSNWEAAMMAAHYRLDNLVAIVDRNGLQITGSTEDVCQLAPLDEKFEAFGFAVQRCNGNDIGELVQTFDAIPFRPGKPSLVLAKTRKGKGVSFMENVAKWHHGVPSDDEFSRAMSELEAAEAVLA